MYHRLTKDEKFRMASMGKMLEVLAITTTTGEANTLMERDGKLAVIGCFGPFVFLANLYDPGEKGTTT